MAARHFLVTDDTVASWIGSIEEDEPGAGVKTTVPVNKFPNFVAPAFLSRRAPSGAC